MIKYNQIWNPIKIQQNHTLDLCLGPLHLWIHRGKQEWHIAHEYDSAADDRFSASLTVNGLSNRTTWTRWIVNDTIDEIHLSPRMPDRPVVVRPEMAMCLLPKQSVQFFVGIPLWIAISFGPGKIATEIPTIQLSNSWFGTFTEGELCYALKTMAKLNRVDLLLHAHRTIFPLEIRNTSNETLNFERLCIRSQHLNIYQGKLRLWANKGRVSYRGEENWSRIVYSRNAPEFDEAGAQIGTAREMLERGTLLQTFDNFKQRVDLS